MYGYLYTQVLGLYIGAAQEESALGTDGILKLLKQYEY
jgi:hypothetical protein